MVVALLGASTKVPGLSGWSCEVIASEVQALAGKALYRSIRGAASPETGSVLENRFS